MVCRTTRIGSAVTSHARLWSGLLEQQCLSTYHELLREGRNAPTPTQAEINHMIDNQVVVVNADQALTEARRRSLLNRLEAARTERMDGRTFYAASRLHERTFRARAALNEYYDGVARDMGLSRAEVERQIADQVNAAERDRSLRAPRDWQRQFQNRAEHQALPLDRNTAYALHALEEGRRQQRAAQPTRRTVTLEPVTSSVVRSLGYDPESGRLEVELHSTPGLPYAYRVPPNVYRALRSGSIGSYWATNIRGNAAYRYDTVEEQIADGVRTQCGTCGQFSGAAHSCPPRDSAEERNRTQRLARQRARATREQVADQVPADIAADGAEQAQGPREPVRMGSVASRRYYGDSGSFRAPNLTTVQQEARQHGAVNIGVIGAISRVASEAGPQSSSGDVRGRVNVEYLGRGRGFQVSAVTEPGDSGEDNLRCTCPDYRANYDCVHVRQTVADLQARINQDRLRDRHRIAEAAQAVGADLARERAESVEAQEESQSTWGAPEVLYAEDRAAFQAAYRAARARRDAGEEPVEYMRANATDGLGAPGTGRGFGVELEFDLTGLDWRERSAALAAIGRELYSEGLTRYSDQRQYHSDRNTYFQHERGWKFENDCSVDGEIISPVMYDTPQTWETLEKVCNIIKRHGGTATVRTGAHVHVSAGNYDHTVENHNRLLGTFRENEDLLYRLGSNPERGTHRGGEYCAPNRVPAEGYRDVWNASASNEGHYIGMNLGAVTGRESDHVEFRMWDGSINPSVIQTQIKMSLAMTEAAFRDTDYVPGAGEQVGSRRAHNRNEHGATRRLTGEAWDQDTESVRKLADRLFRRKADKEQLASLFAVTKWQRRLWR